MYDEGTKGALLASLRQAGARTSKAYLRQHPIKASWQDATQELLQQYEEVIEANLPNIKQGMHDRRHQMLRPIWCRGSLGCLAIRLANHLSHLQATTHKGQRAKVPPVISTTILIDAWCTAKFTGNHQQHFF